MKRLLALIALLFLALVGVASATSLNFQNPTDFTQISLITTTGSGSMSWYESGIGGNNYVKVYHDATTFGFSGMRLKSPLSTTYAAATYLGTDSGIYIDPYVALFDSSGNVLDGFGYAGGSPIGRWEVKIVGGIPKYYIEGVLVRTGPTLVTNPSYVAFGAYSRGYSGQEYWDNYVYGSSSNKYVFGISESDNEMFVILKDITNPSAAGLAFGGNGTVVNSNNMLGTWSRGNDTTPLTNESIQLVNYLSGTVYQTTYTGNAFSGSYSFDILTNVLNNANAPMGLYAITILGSGAYSNQIWYKSNGASVTWSSKTYSMGDSGSIITVVASGGYWDTSAYTYSLGVMDVYGGWHGPNTTITTQTSTVTHSWNAATDSPGVYYAILTATSRSTGVSYILGYDYTTLSSYANFNGVVHDAQTGLPISGAFVNFTQGFYSSNSTTISDGNYSAIGFSAGSSLTINSSALGYRSYNYTFVPLAARGVSLNISLVPTTPSFTGLAIGGVDRDTTYGRPISSALVTVRNTTTGLYCYKTTSFTGWYLNDETSCLFQSKTPYDVWAYKQGYTNSTTEKAVTA